MGERGIGVPVVMILGQNGFRGLRPPCFCSFFCSKKSNDYKALFVRNLYTYFWQIFPLGKILRFFSWFGLDLPAREYALFSLDFLQQKNQWIQGFSPVATDSQLQPGRRALRQCECNIYFLFLGRAWQCKTDTVCQLLFFNSYSNCAQLPPMNPVNPGKLWIVMDNLF